MPRLVITLMGNAQACLYDRPVLRLESGKTGALLAYLATEAGHAHSRQALVDLLWPERANAEGLNSLRFALANLRAVLQDPQTPHPVLLVTRSQVQINPQADVWVDATHFHRRAVEFEAAVSQGNAPSLIDLQATLGVCSGVFLQGVNLSHSLGFESWALSKREQLERLRLRLLYFLGAGLEANGNFSQAEEAYRRILETQPWDENIHQRIMHLLASTGQYATAVAQYALCRQALNEIEIEPGHKTNLLYHHIKRQQADSIQADSLPPEACGEISAPPFVARQRELARLTDSLAHALAGQGQVVFVSGEAGSGKTTLLQQFAAQALAQHPDLLVTGGRCEAYTGLGQPYQPFIESVQMLAGEWEALPWVGLLPPENCARLQQAIPQTAQVLTQKAPEWLNRFINCHELTQRLQAQAKPMPTDGGQQRALNWEIPCTPATTPLQTGLFFEQTTRLFVEMARIQPLLVLLDDIQWIDPGGAALLFHLARRITASRILILAAYRSAEIHLQGASGSHPLLGVVTELKRYASSNHIDLEQTDEQAFVTDMVSQDPLLQPNHLGPAFCTALARRTGGNPLFTIELLRSLQARGELLRSADGYWISSSTLDWDHLPERVEAAIAGRIARLPPQWIDWLSTASVEGEGFSLEVLARVHETDEQSMRQDFSRLLGKSRAGHRFLQAEGVQWINAEGQRSAPLSRYRFRHALFQTYLYQQLDAVERSRRHAAVAVALESLYAGQAETISRHAADLARHFEAGGQPGKAAYYHLLAGKQAAYLASAQVTVSHYRRGLELLASQPHTPERDRLEISLYLALGAPFLSASGWGGEERQHAVQRAVELFENMSLERQALTSTPHTPPGEWPELWIVLYTQADYLISQGELLQATELGKQMLNLAEDQANWPRALAHRILSAAYLFQGKFAIARHHLEAALAANAASKTPAQPWQIEGDLETLCRAMLAFVLAVSGYPAQAQEQVELSLRRARSLGRFSLVGSALIFACEVAVLRHDLAALQDMANELLQLGQPEAEAPHFFRAYGWAMAGYIKTLQADPGSQQAVAGVELIRHGREQWQSTGTRGGLGQWVVRLATACLQAGQIEAGLEVINGALADDTQRIGAGLAPIYRLRGELLLRQEPSHQKEAQGCFIRSLEIAQAQGAHTLELQAAICLAKLWQCERPAAAQELLTGICSRFIEGQEPPEWQEAQALLRQIARHS